ncbi:MAG TPA: TadE/TadG family type IV pilus assembly protein [Sphingomicrobium sp.]|jgi:Flp pilus assembly protein TadG|nr:TadE/TadG family type IV pilus assembly protein [Sphingomicrobium sp.]
MSGRANLRNASGGSITVEFALVLPILLIFLLGIIDAGRFMWTWNQAEKATQMGARYAAVTDAADDGMALYDYYTNDGIARGEPIPSGNFGTETCTSTGCTCNTGETCPTLGALSPGFANTVARMRAIMPEIQAENVTIEYSFSGLGYSGDPSGPDVNPLITVRLRNMSFRPSWLSVLAVPLPTFASTLSMEDGVGTISN